MAVMAGTYRKPKKIITDSNTANELMADLGAMQIEKAPSWLKKTSTST